MPFAIPIPILTFSWIVRLGAPLRQARPSLHYLSHSSPCINGSTVMSQRFQSNDGEHNARLYQQSFQELHRRARSVCQLYHISATRSDSSRQRSQLQNPACLTRLMGSTAFNRQPVTGLTERSDVQSRQMGASPALLPVEPVGQCPSGKVLDHQPAHIRWIKNCSCIVQSMH